MIILMVVFHLVWFSTSYPYAKAVVYTFHMPVFLLISGYFCHTDSAPRKFLRQVLWFFIPYAIMETAYTTACFLLPINEHITSLTPGVIAYHVFVHPLGPYWYLHTLILCQLFCYGVFRMNVGRSLIGNLILLVLLFCVAHRVVVFANALYFMAGFILLQTRTPLLSFFRSSPLALIPLVFLCSVAGNLDRATLAGSCINYLVVSFLLFVIPRLPGKANRILLFVGRNTLVVLLFSPIFTLVVKPLLPFFTWDPTHIIPMMISVVVCLAGCMGLAWLMDRMNLSRLFFGHSRILK